MGYALPHDARQKPGKQRPSAALLGKWQHILMQKCPDATSNLNDVQNWVALLCRSQGLPWDTAIGLAATIPWDGRELIVRLDNSMDSMRSVFKSSGVVPQPKAASIFQDMCTFIRDQEHKQKTPKQDTRLAGGVPQPEKRGHQGPSCFQDLVILSKAE